MSFPRPLSKSLSLFDQEDISASQGFDTASELAGMAQEQGGQLPSAMEFLAPQELRHGAGVAASTLLPELRLAPLFGKLAPEAGSFLSTLTNPVADVAKTAGASTLGSMIEGAPLHEAAQSGQHAMLSQALMSIPGMGARMLGHGAELINPQRFAGKIAEEIRQLHGMGRLEQATAFNPFDVHLGNEKVTNTPRKSLGLTKSESRYLTPDIKKARTDFNQNPTAGNLHKLQSQMYKDAAKLEGNTSKINTYQNIMNARKKANNLLENFGQKKDHAAFAEYQRARDVTRQQVFPYEENKILEDIVSSKKPLHEFDPNKLLKALQESSIVKKAKKGEAIAHPLLRLEQDMARKMYQSELAKYGIPGALGAIAGHAVFPGYGTAAGTALGAVVGHKGGKKMASIVQNPELQRVLKAAEDYAKLGTRAYSEETKEGR